MNTQDKINDLARFELTWFLENGAAADISNVQSYLQALFTGTYQDQAIDKMWRDKCAEDAHEKDCPAIDGFGCRCDEAGAGSTI